MQRAFDVQAWGSILVIAVFLASELSAEALSRWPGSGLAWYLNLELFRVFEAARVESSPLHVLFGPSAALVAALLILGLVIAWRARARLTVAVGANLSFVFAAALAYSSWVEGAPDRLASLGPGRDGGGEGAVVAPVLLIASTMAFALSHLGFAVAIAAERRARGDPPPRPATP
jgi:hypothetical protein